MKRSHRWLFALISAVWFGGLGGCASCGSSSAECPFEPCESGEVCREGTCVAEGSCPGGCLEGQTCSNGACVWEEVQCEATGDPCEREGPTNEGFLCVPWTGNPADAECADVCSRDGECPDGSACVLLQTPGDTTCESNADCQQEKTCSQGFCRFAACRPSECEGPFVGNETCQEEYGDDERRFPNGAKCRSVQNGANFCLPAGEKARGESCTGLASAIEQNDYTETCGPGLACEEGTCVEVCTSEEDCEGKESCIGVDSPQVAEGLGQCAETCEPFTEGACDEGETCKPVVDGAGRCVEAGDTEVYSSCAPGGGECEEGTVCVTYQTGDPRIETETIARCHPLCDLSAGERTEDGTLTAEAQERRDATCPQPDPSPASARIVHAESAEGPVDLYRSDRTSPLATALAPGSTTSGEDGPFFAFSPGEYDFSALPEGAPETDVPLVEWSHRFGEGDSRVFALTAPDSESGDGLRAIGFPPFEEQTFEGGRVGIRVVHGLTGSEQVDVVAVEPGGEPGEASGGSELATELGFGTDGEPVGVEPGTYDVYVFPAGADRSEADAELVRYDELAVDGRSTLVLHGTIDPTDAYDTTPAVLVDAPPAPEPVADQPRTTCVEQEGGGLGYCQQVCTGGASDYGQGVCRGDEMGCTPMLRGDRQRREHLCAPIGDGDVGDVCNTFAEFGECKEGNYCLEYGNTREGYESITGRGLCHSLCAVSGEGSPALSCSEGESCKPLNYRGEFSVGQCNIPCEPDETYTGESCPDGLRSCRPVASLQGDLGGQGNSPPVVRREQAFCSASGDVEPERSCRAQNCQPAGECLFERSQQRELVRSLLSPYFPTAAGSAPTCRPRCDPFDGDDSAFECGEGETCLFNYPWSAEVGHCADIQEMRSPGESCETPGLACGPDSICVEEGGSKSCMRFCEYEGADVQGELEQSTCPSGFRCHPFVRDVGVCQR